MSSEDPPPLLQLNHDMLMAVIDVLGAHNELTSFSRTCKVIREFCMPVLFRHCKIKVYHPVELENSLEARRSLWPYIRSLTMKDYCDDRGKITRPGMLLKHTMDPLLCGVYNPRELGTALRNMPRLHAVSMVLCWAEGHGLPWSVLDAVLTVPHLREFTCDHHEFSPRPIIPKETKNFTDPPAALTAFHYIVSDYRHNSRGYPPEADALRIVLGSLHRTLQILDLPTEPTSLRHISSLAWPVLRELRLRGELHPAEDRPVPLISALAHMSALRVLDLRFSVTKGSHVPAPPIWPSGLHATYPWPDLKHLVISYANTDDQLFQHLPPTLRRLTLQYFPHLGPSEWDGINTLPVVSLRRYSSYILHILRLCPIPQLDELEVDYHQDGEEYSLLRYITAAFPALTSLKVRRYCASDATDVDVESIALLIKPLVHLRILHLHLDIPVAGISTEYWFPSLEKYQKVQDRAADTIAPHLGPCVELLKLGRLAYSWAVYRVLRDDADIDGGRAAPVRVQYDSVLSGDPVFTPITVVISPAGN